jgi:hypothetical protein
MEEHAPLCALFETGIESYATQNRSDKAGTQKNKYLGELFHEIAKSRNELALAHFLYTYFDIKTEAKGALFGRLLNYSILAFITDRENEDRKRAQKALIQKDPDTDISKKDRLALVSRLKPLIKAKADLYPVTDPATGEADPKVIVYPLLAGAVFTVTNEKDEKEQSARENLADALKAHFKKDMDAFRIAAFKCKEQYPGMLVKLEPELEQFFSMVVTTNAVRDIDAEKAAVALRAGFNYEEATFKDVFRYAAEEYLAGGHSNLLRKTSDVLAKLIIDLSNLPDEESIQLAVYFTFKAFLESEFRAPSETKKRNPNKVLKTKLASSIFLEYLIVHYARSIQPKGSALRTLLESKVEEQKLEHLLGIDFRRLSLIDFQTNNLKPALKTLDVDNFEKIEPLLSKLFSEVIFNKARAHIRDALFAYFQKSTMNYVNAVSQCPVELRETFCALYPETREIIEALVQPATRQPSYFKKKEVAPASANSNNTAVVSDNNEDAPPPLTPPHAILALEDSFQAYVQKNSGNVGSANVIYGQFFVDFIRGVKTTENTSDDDKANPVAAWLYLTVDDFINGYLALTKFDLLQKRKFAESAYIGNIIRNLSFLLNPADKKTYDEILKIKDEGDKSFTAEQRLDFLKAIRTRLAEVFPQAMPGKESYLQKLSKILFDKEPKDPLHKQILDLLKFYFVATACPNEELRARHFETIPMVPAAVRENEVSFIQAVSACPDKDVRLCFKLLPGIPLFVKESIQRLETAAAKEAEAPAPKGIATLLRRDSRGSKKDASTATPYVVADDKEVTAAAQPPAAAKSSGLLSRFSGAKK